MKQKSNTILIIALDFPPCKSAGVQRTLLFCKYLKQLGWNPVVLTVDANAHLAHDDSTSETFDFPVYRAHSLNSKRDLSIKGKTISWLQSPDKFWTWYYTAVPLGLKLLKKYNPSVIWSTYPVLTAHRIANKLAKKSGVPWIADYRDPVQARYDFSQTLSKTIRRIERSSVERASKLVFTTKQASLLYQSLYETHPTSKFCVIPNGFDSLHVSNEALDNSNKFLLLHSGAVYENGRDPTQLFIAIHQLKKEGFLTIENFSLVFRGCDGDRFKTQITDLSINELVSFLPSISYKESVIEMSQASALLLLQGELFTNQIPGKLYEYLATNKPVVCICPAGSATHTEINEINQCYQANSEIQIRRVLIDVISNKHVVERDIAKFSRKEGAIQLASLLEVIAK